MFCASEFRSRARISSVLLVQVVINANRGVVSAILFFAPMWWTKKTSIVAKSTVMDVWRSSTRKRHLKSNVAPNGFVLRAGRCVAVLPVVGVVMKKIGYYFCDVIWLLLIFFSAPRTCVLVWIELVRQQQQHAAQWCSDISSWDVIWSAARIC